MQTLCLSCGIQVIVSEKPRVSFQQGISQMHCFPKYQTQRENWLKIISLQLYQDMEKFSKRKTIEINQKRLLLSLLNNNLSTGLKLARSLMLLMTQFFNPPLSYPLMFLK